VDRVLATIEEARRKSCGNLTLRDLVQEQETLAQESTGPRRLINPPQSSSHR
jgi:hypothetical protein